MFQLPVTTPLPQLVYLEQTRGLCGRLCGGHLQQQRRARALAARGQPLGDYEDIQH